MSDAIRPTDSLKLSTRQPPPAQAPQPATAPQPRYAQDGFTVSPPTPEQLDRLHKANLGLKTVKRPPRGVLEQRAWVAEVKPLAIEMHKARTAVQTAALQHGAVPREKLDYFKWQEESLASIIMEVEEMCGLRKPQPPRDPNRPVGEATKEMLDNAKATLGVTLALTPVAVIADVADLAGRPSEARAYPFAKMLYKQRLAEYEQALRDHPL